MSPQPWIFLVILALLVALAIWLWLQDQKRQEAVRLWALGRGWRVWPGGEGGPLVLRCGEHLSAVTDDYDEELGENDIDLRSFELVETVSVRGLVGALNGLLARTSFDRRFLMLVADGKREVYVAVPSFMRSRSSCAMEGRSG